MGDPFGVDVPSHVLSAGRTDLRLLRGDAFSVVQSYKEIKINKIRGSNYGQFLRPFGSKRPEVERRKFVSKNKELIKFVDQITVN